MTLFKLSYRNLKKSVKDYAIYFATLVLGVVIFYVFNALDSQKAMMVLDDSSMLIIDVLIQFMSYVSVFIAAVLGFLIVYASGFLMKRRKKEFAIYMLLGMSKRRIASILVVETVIIGIVSLFVGLLLGVLASQGMSIIVANLFEADLTAFRFTVSTSAIYKTLFYFLLIYAFVILCDVFVVGKARLIKLINAGRMAEKNYARNPVICVIAFATACYMLGTAYYAVTAGIEDITSFGSLGKQILKGMIGTVLVFWSLAGILFIIVKKCKRYYYKGLNCFSVKELNARINSNVVSGSVICIMLFFTICGLSCSQAVRQSANNMLRENARADIELTYPLLDGEHEDNTFSIKEYLEQKGVGGSFKDAVEVNKYCIEDESGFVSETEYNMMFDVMTLTDFNNLALLYGCDTLELTDEEYAISCNHPYAMGIYNGILAEEKNIVLSGISLKPGYKKCIKMTIGIEASYVNTGTIIVPDKYEDAMSKASCWSDLLYIANYAASSNEEYAKTEEFVNSDSFYETLFVEKTDYHINCHTKTQIKNDNVGLSTIVVFIGLYLGIVFLVSAAAILSLKELSGAADNKQKYEVLRKLGVDERAINRSLFSQNLFFFALPLVLAIVHSFFGIQTGMFILETFGRSGLTGAIILSAAVILGIYTIYFALTYMCSKEIIKDAR